jgi:DnaJ-class molecular chaperone
MRSPERPFTPEPGPRPCPQCQGAKKVKRNGKEETCPTCKGKGTVVGDRR